MKLILQECSRPLLEIGHVTKIDTGSKFKTVAAVILNSVYRP